MHRDCSSLSFSSDVPAGFSKRQLTRIFLMLVFLVFLSCLAYGPTLRGAFRQRHFGQRCLVAGGGEAATSNSISPGDALGYENSCE